MIGEEQNSIPPVQVSYLSAAYYIDIKEHYTDLNHAEVSAQCIHTSEHGASVQYIYVHVLEALVCYGEFKLGTKSYTTKYTRRLKYSHRHMTAPA